MKKLIRQFFDALSIAVFTLSMVAIVLISIVKFTP